MKELPDSTDSCCHCGKDLHGMRLARPGSASQTHRYRIIPDGALFGIAVGSETKIHGLDLKRAESLVRILNSVKDVEDTG